MRKQPSTLSRYRYRYGLALLVSALAFILTHSTRSVLQAHAFDFYLGAVVISACYGGLGPALLTAILAIPTLNFFFMPPFYKFSLSATDVMRLSIFTFVATLTSSLLGRLKEAQARLQAVNEALQGEIEQRLIAEKEVLQISHREQRRLGEDLHDGLCQTLVGLRYIAQDLREAVKVEGLSWAQDVARIDERLGEALNQADLVARGLYPVELETNGLHAALGELTDKISVIYRVRCRLRYADEKVTLDLPVANHLYRVAQEAVVNAIKHGKSKRVSVQLQRRQNQYVLSVTDDGVGMKTPGQRQGMGLKMMQYRARLINADFRIRSRTRGVTRVTCHLRKESDDGIQIQQS